ncbi:aspartate aminotransferase [Vibrio variabilis]|nr:aspartate aminotransferase [Vibrio variabilis]
MKNIGMSSKLDNVCYDIRGPVLKHAKRMEEEGHKILKLNIGNPAPFGFDA